MTDKIITAAILVIGDEILSGRTKDRNIGYIADYLTNLGVETREARVVPDIEAEIVAALDALRARYSYVFTTGGIGPTHDDVTADAVAKAFGVAIDEDPRALAMMMERYKPGELTPARV
jgi:molybdenum cofactor synthesis domain-containing protein